MSEEKQILDDLARTRNQVIFVLNKYPETCNNDFYLTLLVLREFYVPEMPYFHWEKIKECAGKLKTINNIRQQLNREGKYKATDPEVLRRREIKRQVYRKAFSPAQRNEDIV